jgi:ribulose-5-phosphate 4-epimerase/fuculose-1-phosphate aldolase
MATKKPAKKKADPALDAVIEDLVAGNRILADQRVLDAYGHISARHPSDPERYLLSRSLAPQLVTPKDLMVFDLDSNALDGDDRSPYLERFIHGEIYRARPDVMAVVHSHSMAVIPFASSAVRLKPVYHMGGFLGSGVPVFDIRKGFGNTDLLVRNGEQGKALAADLGAGAVALMRGHGFVACGETVPVAVFRAIYTQANATIQQGAIGMGGEVTYLNVEEAALADVNNHAMIGRPWELWKAGALKK